MRYYKFISKGIQSHEERKPYAVGRSSGLPVVDINDLKSIAEGIAGTPERAPMAPKIVAAVEYRNGIIIDVVRQSSTKERT
jgi:citrate lyase alpha subunit